MDLVAAIGQWLSLSWNFFTDIKVPGFDFSFAVIFTGVFIAVFGLRLLYMVLHMGDAGGGSYGGSKAGKTKIAKERQHDER